MKKTIWLQSLGECSAIPSEEIKPGMLVSWNYAFQEYEVVSIRPVSKCFFEMVERNIKTGTEYKRRLKRGRLVAAQFVTPKTAAV